MSGIEVVGAVASIGQLIELGLRTTEAVLRICDDWRNGPEKSFQRLDTVRHLQQIIAALATEQDLDPALAEHPIKSMVTKLLKIEQILAKSHHGSHRKYRKMLNSVRNQTRNKEIQDLLVELERDKTTFLLLLGYLNIHLHRKPQSSVSPQFTPRSVSVDYLCTFPTKGKRGPICTIPETAIPQFIGQKQQLSSITTVFTGNLQEKCVVVLNGPAGAGKSQLALKFCRDQQQDAMSLLWIDCSSHKQICNSFIAAARKLHKGVPCKNQYLQPQESISCVQEFLRTTEHRWVIVFDNWDNLDDVPDVLKLLPASCSGCCLITSRNPQTMRLGTAIELNGMIKDDAVDLLFAKTQVQDRDPVEVTGMQIVIRLGCLPLAIDQASSYIKTMGISLEEFLQHYETNMFQILSHTPSIWEYRKFMFTEEECRSASVFTTCELTLRSFADDRHLTRTFLNILGFLCGKSINETLFQAFFEFHTGIEAALTNTPSRKALIDTLGQFRNADGQWDRKAFSDTIIILREKRLLEATSVMADGTLSLSLHPLVSDWLRTRRGEEQSDILFRQACDLVQFVAETRTSETDCSLEFWQQLVTHADSLLVHWKTLATMGERGWYQTILAFSNLYFRRGYYNSALEGYQILLTSFVDTNSQDSLLRYETLCWQARSYHRLGEYRLAETAAEQAVRGLGEDNAYNDAAATITAKETLADLYRSRGAYSEAEAIYASIVACHSTTYGEFHERTISALANLAVIFKSQGKIQEAHTVYKKIMKHFWSATQETDFKMIWIQNDYATFLKSQGRFEEADSVYEKVLLVRERFLGPHHHDTLWTLVDFADNLKAQSKYIASRRLYENAIYQLKRYLGELHPETLWAADGLGDLCAKLGCLEEAEDILSRVLQARARVLGDRHHNTMRTMHNLANVYFLQGRIELSRISYEIALEGLTQSLGPHHSKTEGVRASLAKIPTKCDAVDSA